MSFGTELHTLLSSDASLNTYCDIQGDEAKKNKVITMEQIRWKEAKKKKPPAKPRKVEVKAEDIEELMIPDACRYRTARKEGVKWRSRITDVYK